MLSANGLGWTSIIYPGQVAIPGPGLALDAAPRGLPDPVPRPRAPAAPRRGAAPAPPPPPAHVGACIVRGDTISAIAQLHGVSTQAVLDANGLDARRLIFPGQPCSRIPGLATPDPAARSGALDANEEARTRRPSSGSGASSGSPKRGIMIALATAMQESSLRNLDWGDRDSVGLFQQRPTTGWGTVEELATPIARGPPFYGGPTNPNAGFTRGLLDIPGWQSMSFAEAAQAVQISAFPMRTRSGSSARSWFAAHG